jgi:hypothetical protein
MSALRLLAAVVLLALAPSRAIAACPEDLAANDLRFKQTLERLESVKNGTQKQKCVAYRSHVRIMEQGREVFARCNSGTTQRENVGQMNDSIADFRELIKRRC